MKSFNKEVQLVKYYQDTNINRIGQNLKKMLVFCAIAITTTSTTTLYAATLSPDCAVNVNSATEIEIIATSGGLTVDITSAAIGVNAIEGDLVLPELLQCISLSPPTDVTVPCAISAGTVTIPGDGTIVYVSQYDVPENTYCSYEVSLTPTSASAVAFVPPITPTNPTNPTAVPIFTPLGILATISGLLWFGRRRSIKIKN